MADFFMMLAGGLLLGWWLIDLAIFSLSRWVPSKPKLSIAGSAIAGISIAGLYIKLHPSVDLGLVLLAVAGCVIGSGSAFALAKHEGTLRESTDWKPLKDLRGVGDWLLFLMVSLLYLSPGRTALETAQSVIEAEKANPQLNGLPIWNTMLSVEWAIVSISVLSCIYAGLLIRSAHRRGTVNLVMSLIWFVGLMPIFENIAISNIAGQPIFDESSISAIVSGLFYAAIWSAYLLKSRRVASTYIG